jgi:hypothetical protein
VAADGELTVTFEVTATCPGGQWLDSAATDITVSGTDGVYASGLFDLSGTPFWLPEGEPVRLPLAFPADTVFGTEDEVDEAIGSGTVHVDCVQDADQPTPAEPSEEPEPTEQPEPADPSEGGTAEEPGVDGGRETALQALRRIAREDLATVGGDLVDHWVPQLSSKYFGLRAEGRRWTYQAILAEHLDLRLRYPNVRLLYSSDWNFQVPDVWVTMTGVTYPHWPDVLSFCLGEGRVYGDCSAKFLRRGGPWEGTTAYVTDEGTIPPLRDGPTRDGRRRPGSD